jgi:hypothetical protein
VVCAEEVEIVLHALRFLLEREVLGVVDFVECACGVGVEGGEDRAEVVPLGAALGDKLKGAVVGAVVGEAVDEDASSWNVSAQRHRPSSTTTRAPQ